MRAGPSAVIMDPVRTRRSTHPRRSLRLAWSAAFACACVQGPDAGDESSESAHADDTDSGESEGRECWVDDECEPGWICEAGQCVPDPCAEAGGEACEPEDEAEPCYYDDSDCDQGVCINEQCLDVPILPSCTEAPTFVAAALIPEALEDQLHLRNPAYLDLDGDGLDELLLNDPENHVLVRWEGAQAVPVLVLDTGFASPRLHPLRDGDNLGAVFGRALLDGDGGGGLSLAATLEGGQFTVSRVQTGDFWGLGRDGVMSLASGYGATQLWVWSDDPALPGTELEPRLIASDLDATLALDLDGDGRDTIVVLSGDHLWRAELVAGGWIEPETLHTAPLPSFESLAAVGPVGGPDVLVAFEARQNSRTVLSAFVGDEALTTMVQGYLDQEAVGDFDGDGLREVLLFDDDWPPPIYVDFSATGVPLCAQVQAELDMPDSVYEFSVGDPDGDGVDQIVARGNNYVDSQDFWLFIPQ